MADQRPFSRFRLPWLSTPVAAAPPPPRPAAEPQPRRPTVETIQAPPQPTQRPPFRPAGIAPVISPPPQPQAPQRTEPQPPSPPRATTVQPASPSRATTETRAASVPPSPTRSTSQTQSASRAAPQPRAASLPPSPTRSTSQPQPTQQIEPQPQSRLTDQTSSQPSSPSTKATQVQPTVSLPTSPPKKLQPAIQETSKPSSLSFSQTAEPRKSLSEPTEVKATEEEKKVVEKLKSEGKISGPAKEEPLRSAITELLAASGAGSEAKEKQQEKEDKKTMSISSNGEYIKTVSSTQPKARSKLTESHQKPRMPNGEQVSLQKEIRDDIFKFVHKLGVGQLKYPADEKPVSIVTIAGENRGASMHVGSEPARKDESIHIHRGYKLNPDDSTGATTDGEASKEARKLKKEDPVKKAYVNSNAQSINNSMVFDSSVNERNPGIQLVLSENLAKPTKPSAKPESLETYKAEFNVTPAQKLTYEPTIRRRCLRGLLLESSDSDPGNPEKPRRHGCRYNCGEKNKDKDIGVL